MKTSWTQSASCRRCLTSLFSAFVLLASCTPARAAKQDNVPEWVRTAAHQTLPAYPPETNAVVLLDQTTYLVGPDGQATETRQRVVKILRPQGRRDALVEVPYDRDTKVISLHVWSIGPDGHEYALKDNEIVDHGYFGDTSMYLEDRVKVAQAPGADPGGIVAYEVERKVRPYLTETTWFYQDDVPRLKQSFTLELPPGFTYGTAWAHLDKSQEAGSKAIDLEHQRYRWEMDNTPGIDLDRVPMRPNLMSLAGRMTVHYGGATLPNATVDTWQSIGQWYETLKQNQLTATPEVATKASELVAGKTDFYDKTEAVGEFVQQQIRYFAVELGIGGYQPHYAGEIFHNRYGDCKDKATLLTAMLGSVGVHAALVMVDTRRGVIDPAAPSIVGNHMIAAIEIPKGYDSPKLRSVVTAKTGRRYLIFDPTWDKTPFGQLESNLQGGYGVLMEGNDSQVIALPVLSPELNTIRRNASFQLQADGTLSGTVKESRFGDVSERRREMFISGDAKEQLQYVDHMLERDFTSFKVADVKAENMQALNKDMTLSYSLNVERFGKTMGPLLMVRPRVLGAEGFNVDKKPRTVPINLYETMQEKDEYEIEMPAGYAMDEMPEPVKVDMGFAAYESSSEMKDGKLHYTRTYTVREVTLPADKYGEVRKLAEVIDADEQVRAVLKKKQP